MTALLHLRTLLTCALLAAGATSAAASAGGQAFLTSMAQSGYEAEAAATAEPLQLAQADCSAAAAQAAAQTGGQVLSVSASNQGGQTVCVVTVLIPGQGGERPRRTTITLPG